MTPIGECLSPESGAFLLSGTLTLLVDCAENHLHTDWGHDKRMVALSTVVNLRPAKTYMFPTGLSQPVMSLPTPLPPQAK